MNPDSVDIDKKDLPRKRSKVSRACDLCRRKKIRCDAEYLTALQKVTKVCTNCSKNSEVCTFSRIPLKRGPSKGYIRDLVDRMDDSYSSTNTGPTIQVTHPIPAPVGPNLGSNTSGPGSVRLRSHLIDGPIIPESPRAVRPPPLPQTHLKPVLYRLAFSPSPGTPLPIILPPLLGAQPLTQPVKLSVPVGVYDETTANTTNNITNNVNVNNAGVGSGGLQGPLWKVPYEMPLRPGLAGSSPGYTSRRLSVDLVSLILTAGSRLRLPLLKLEIFVDSDDDYKLPRNSVSLMLLLNGRMAKLLWLPSPVNGYLNGQCQNLTQSLSLNQSLILNPNLNPNLTQNQNQNQNHNLTPNGHGYQNGNGYQNGTPCVLHEALSADLATYYRRFHRGFPLLPPENIMRALLTESHLLHLFGAALHNLVYFQLCPVDSLSDLIRQILALPVHDILLVLALVIANYTVLVSGGRNLVGIALAVAVMNDMKVLERYAEYVKGADKAVTTGRISSAGNSTHAIAPETGAAVSTGSSAGVLGSGVAGINTSGFPGSAAAASTIDIHLVRLYYCLTVIDNCHALSFGTMPLTACFDVLHPFVGSLFPESFSSTAAAASIVNDIVKMRTSAMFSSLPRRYPLWATPTAQDFPAFFILLVSNKYEVYTFLSEAYAHLQTTTADENIHDYQFKCVRLTKKLLLSILNFANYVSTVYSQMKAAADLINPFFPMAYGQCFKLIKACKLLVDSLLLHVSDNEIITCAIKINNDLSIAFNLLLSNLNNNYSGLANARNAPTADTLDTCGLGATSLATISAKLEVYNLSFGTLPMSEDSARRATNLNLWKLEFINIFTSFVAREDIDGWY